MKRIAYLTIALLVAAGCTARPVGGPEGWKVYGPAGPEGPQGVAGLIGPAGPQGPQGAQGPAGARGADLLWRQFGDVQFEVGKEDLRPFDADKVLELAAYLKQNPTFRVELEGFADPRGSETYNMKLSSRRVNVVRDALIAAGVDKERILVGAYGELNLKCTQNAEECWQQDRRVEIIVLPTTDLKATTLRTGNGK